ncbi:MAG TPA: threo-3-hydroxy-L-aspartate ammonia-lyase [Candidatus Polarisedimenticolaceae bacterium]|nr:threo-3-hydroxy-L-aspartate ammonia-lyase [Candidatus Polarisedimenticolaceae bacterium]
MDAVANVVGWDDIVAASTRLRGIARKTPVMTSSQLDERLGAKVFLKCETFQRAGAFKIRGAYNAISRIADEDRARGVVAYSSGNHAQAVALACRLLGMKATIVMPKNAAKVKRTATEAYGARIVTYDPATEKREEVARGIGGVLIPPFDHPHVVAGQGTVAKELFEEEGELDLLLVPCGGGGLLSGSSIAARALSPRCKVIGVEPAGADDAARSFRSGRLERCDHPETIADGARTASLGEITFPIIRKNVDDIVTVSDREIVVAMKLLWERMKLVVEPTGALGLAAALAGKVEIGGKRVGVVVSGGNVDLVEAAELMKAI